MLMTVTQLYVQNVSRESNNTLIVLFYSLIDKTFVLTKLFLLPIFAVARFSVGR